MKQSLFLHDFSEIVWWSLATSDRRRTSKVSLQTSSSVPTDKIRIIQDSSQTAGFSTFKVWRFTKKILSTFEVWRPDVGAFSTFGEPRLRWFKARWKIVGNCKWRFGLTTTKPRLALTSYFAPILQLRHLRGKEQKIIEEEKIFAVAIIWRKACYFDCCCTSLSVVPCVFGLEGKMGVSAEMEVMGSRGRRKRRCKFSYSKHVTKLGRSDQIWVHFNLKVL